MDSTKEQQSENVARGSSEEAHVAAKDAAVGSEAPTEDPVVAKEENDSKDAVVSVNKAPESLGETKQIDEHIHDSSARCDFSHKDDIFKIYGDLDCWKGFQLISPQGVSDDKVFDFPGLNREITDKDFILIGSDKCGLSGFLNIPVPPGATLSVQMSTWVTPFCASGVANTCCFGVGMVPFGKGREETWDRGFKTSIENGVQYYADISFEAMVFRMQNSFHVIQEGSVLRHSKSKLSLGAIDVRIQRDASGKSEFSFRNSGHKAQRMSLAKVVRPAGEENCDMQLCFNCLGWADNETYVQIHKVVYEPPAPPGEGNALAGAMKRKAPPVCNRAKILKEESSSKNEVKK